MVPVIYSHKGISSGIKVTFYKLDPLPLPLFSYGMVDGEELTAIKRMLGSC